MFLCEQNYVLIRERFGEESALYGTRTDELVKCDVFYTHVEEGKFRYQACTERVVNRDVYNCDGIN